jgi:acyl carrier protein
MTADWDAWSFGDSATGSALSRVTMTEDEGVAVFDRLVGAAHLAHVVVSTASLYARIGALVGKTRQTEPAPLDEAGRTLYARPAALEATFEQARTPLEQTVSEIWQQVLGLDRVGRRDNFFELGGHSLLAVQVAARLEDALGVEVPMRNVFDAATVADLADRIQVALLGHTREAALVGSDGADVEELEL